MGVTKKANEAGKSSFFSLDGNKKRKNPQEKKTKNSATC